MDPALLMCALDEGPLTDAGARALVEAMPRLAGLAAVHAVAPPLAPAMHRASAAVRAARPEELRTVLAAAWEA